jgi:serine/threonine-protein kinase SRPK3
MTTPTILVRQMLGMASDDLPERWQKSWRDMEAASPGEVSKVTLQSWLEDMYFDGERREDFDREEIRQLGRLVAKMLRFEPCSRASAEEILHDSWFKDAE